MFYVGDVLWLEEDECEDFLPAEMSDSFSGIMRCLRYRGTTDEYRLYDRGICERCGKSNIERWINDVLCR